MITIYVNGNTRQLPIGSTLASLIEAMALTGKRIAVELNGNIVPRSNFSAQTLADGDKLEIVGAVGGG